MIILGNTPSGSFEDSGPVQQEYNLQHSRWLFTPQRLLAIAILVAMFIGAFILRASNFNNSRHVAEVQYRSALIARSIYFNLDDSIPEWRRQANANSLRGLSNKNLLVREPSITELLTGISYKLLGRDDLRIPRLFTSVFWIVGGFFLYKIAKIVASDEGAIVATAYYLFIPLGVVVSISFQSDSLMIMMFMISSYAILQYFEKLTWHKLIIAAILSGFAIFVRPLIFFALTGAFLGLAISSSKGIRQLISKQLFVFFVISYGPAIFYYGYQILITGNLMRQAEVSFLPQLLFTKDYWKDWMQTAVNAVGLTPLLAAMIGIPIVRRGTYKAFLIGLGLGYILFCLVFTYHIRYAGYYHTQLIPIVALSFASIVSVFVGYVRQLKNRWYWAFFYIAAVFLLFLNNYRETNRAVLSSADIESTEIAEAIGEIVDHSNRVVYISSYYGWPLEYYAELTGTYWPRRISDVDTVLGRSQILSVEDRLESLGFVPEYFVITAWSEYNTHHDDLKDYLIENCRLVKMSDQFIIYNSCSY